MTPDTDSASRRARVAGATGRRADDGGGNFGAYMVGWQVMLNPARPVVRTISAVPSATQLQFAGDGVNLAAAGDFYRVFAPPGVMGDANGANWGHQHCDVRYGCSVSFGWAGYRYFAPVAGFVADHSGGGFAIHSRQGASINLVGNYHCWNRVYSPYLGRWTTPDPLASPWWNLQDYCDNSPLQYTDASGLSKCELTIYTTSSDKTQDEGYGSNCGWHPVLNVTDILNVFRHFLSDNPECKCITKVLFVGHGGSGCGKGSSVTDLSEQDRKWLRSQMCEGATVESYKCGSCKLINDIDILTVLLGGDRTDNTRGIMYEHDVRYIFFYNDTVILINPHWPVHRKYIVPKDAGVSNSELDRVRRLNEELWAAEGMPHDCNGRWLEFHRCMIKHEQRRAAAKIKAWTNYRVRGVNNMLDRIGKMLKG